MFLIKLGLHGMSRPKVHWSLLSSINEWTLVPSSEAVGSVKHSKKAPGEPIRLLLKILSQSNLYSIIRLRDFDLIVLPWQRRHA